MGTMRLPEVSRALEWQLVSTCKASQIAGNWAQQPPVPEEVSILSSTASPKRIAEFRAGRACARHVLARMAYENVSIGADEAGCPKWPTGLVGSITHTEDWAGAAVGRSSSIRAIGIDAESVSRMTRDLWRLVFLPDEMTRMLALPKEKQDAFAAVTFSAKESFYKAQYTLTGSQLEFTDVHITLVESGPLWGDFSVKPSFTGGQTLLTKGTLDGRFAVDYYIRQAPTKATIQNK